MCTAIGIVDRFTFTDPNRRQAICRIRLFALSDGRAAVIATELADNPGMSITNAAEEGATAICRRFDIDPHRLVWIEHYDGESYSDQERTETFDLVTFRHIPPTGAILFDGTDWRRMGESDWATLGLPTNGTISA